MPRLTHIFFDLHGTLIDATRLGDCYSGVYGRIMAEKYGRCAKDWEDANRHITADWDSYYADFNLDGDDGLGDIWEGLYRTTRAMFRLTGVPEPHQDELRQLSRWIPGEVPKFCNALYADSKTVLQQLHADGYVLGITSHALVAQAEATLIGGGVRDLFRGPFIGPDVAEQFRKDAMFYRYALAQTRARPSTVLVVDDRLDMLAEAKSVGLHTFNIQRQAPCAEGMQSLLDYVAAITRR